MKPLHLLVISCLCIISACSTNDRAANPMSVQVIDWQGKPIANVTVVMGNQAGAVEPLSSTDAHGEAHFASAPPNATVTAAFSCYAPSANRTSYYVDIAYGVNVSAVTLTPGACDERSQEVNVKVTDKVAGITSRDVTIGPITYGGSDVTIDFGSAVQGDGNISVFAVGYDDAGNIKGYGYPLDRPAVDGSVTDVVIDRTDLVQNTHRFANVPSNTVSHYAYASLLRKHAATNLPPNFSGGAAPVPPTVTTYSSEGFADSHQFGAAADLDRDGDGAADATVGVISLLRNASDQLFDFGLTPPVPGDLILNSGTAGRPVISWSNNDSRSTAQGVTLSYRSNTPQRVSFYYSMTVPASSTGLVFPELPDVLAAFRPEAYSELSLVTMKFDKPAGYDDYLKAVADYTGRFTEAQGMSRYSYARISRLP
jgi:hypothetical protein